MTDKGNGDRAFRTPRTGPDYGEAALKGVTEALRGMMDRPLRIGLVDDRGGLVSDEHLVAEPVVSDVVSEGHRRVFHVDLGRTIEIPVRHREAYRIRLATMEGEPLFYVALSRAPASILETVTVPRTLDFGVEEPF